MSPKQRNPKWFRGPKSPGRTPSTEATSKTIIPFDLLGKSRSYVNIQAPDVEISSPIFVGSPQVGNVSPLSRSNEIQVLTSRLAAPRIQPQSPHESANRSISVANLSQATHINRSVTTNSLPIKCIPECSSSPPLTRTPLYSGSKLKKDVSPSNSSVRPVKSQGPLKAHFETVENDGKWKGAERKKTKNGQTPFFAPLGIARNTIIDEAKEERKSDKSDFLIGLKDQLFEIPFFEMATPRTPKSEQQIPKGDLMMKWFDAGVHLTIRDGEKYFPCHCVQIENKSLASVTNHTSFDIFNQYTPLEIAQQITLQQHHLYIAIHPRELLIWPTSKEKNIDCPKITALILHFNRVAWWACGAVVTRLRLEERKEFLRKIIEVCHHCLEMNNFLAVQSMLSAYSHSSVNRLKKTFSQIEPSLIKEMDSIRDMMSQLGNYSLYRQLLTASQPPRIPYIG
jgi:hypothetical protein